MRFALALLALAVFLSSPAGSMIYEESYLPLGGNAQSGTGTGYPLLVVEAARFVGALAGKMYDPLAWLAIAIAFAIGIYRLDWMVATGLVVGTALAATALNVWVLWDWWAQLPAAHAVGRTARGFWLLALHLVLCGIAWSAGAASRYVFAGSSAAPTLAPPPREPRPISAAMLPPISMPRKHLRYWVAASIVWVSAVLLVFAAFNPFGRSSWRDAEWFKFFVTLLGPSTIGLLALALFAWANREEDPKAQPVQELPDDGLRNDLAGLVGYPLLPSDDIPADDARGPTPSPRDPRAG